jgi:hypothetical protein
MSEDVFTIFIGLQLAIYVASLLPVFLCVEFALKRWFLFSPPSGRRIFARSVVRGFLYLPALVVLKNGGAIALAAPSAILLNAMREDASLADYNLALSFGITGAVLTSIVFGVSIARWKIGRNAKTA